MAKVGNSSIVNSFFYNHFTNKRLSSSAFVSENCDCNAKERYLKEENVMKAKEGDSPKCRAAIHMFNANEVVRNKLRN